jgi:transcriptional regulator with XRE-family HTH domain
MATARHAGGRPRTLQRCPLGQRIERLANVRGLHMDELAAAAGIQTPSLYRILTGEIRSPRLATVQALAKALGVKLEKLA